MRVKCFIIDDEPLAIQVIESYVEKVPWLDVRGTFTDPLNAIDALHSERIDLIFLDIQMPEINGIELLESLKKIPAIIFTTAFRNFAVDAYDLDALDYLVKPIKFPRFLKAVNKFLETSHSSTMPQILQTEIEPGKSAFFIKQGHEMVRLDLDQIMYIESLGDYVKVHLSEERLVVKSSIINLEKQLEDKNFLRIHKSFLIPVSRIISFSKTLLQTKEREFPIGRTYRNAVWSQLGMPVSKKGSD